jgi:hypothetical protein
MGRYAHSESDMVTLEDLRCSIVPGLSALGVRAELIPVTQPRMFIRLISDRLRRGVPVPLFRLAAPGADACDGEEASMEGRIVEWMIATCADLQAHQEPQTGYDYALSLSYGGARGGRVAGRMAALLRWIAFAAAHPERTPGSGPQDRPVVEGAAAFLEVCSGSGRDPIPLRLRRAAEHLHAGDDASLQAGQQALREAVLIYLKLPPVAQQALLSDPLSPLSPLERRELIYMARAGTRELRALAAARLSPEEDLPEVAATLREIGVA